jgi:hypothetical protein
MYVNYVLTSCNTDHHYWYVIMFHVKGLISYTIATGAAQWINEIYVYVKVP